MERNELDVSADSNLDYSLKLAIARDLERLYASHQRQSQCHARSRARSTFERSWANVAGVFDFSQW